MVVILAVAAVVVAVAAAVLAAGLLLSERNLRAPATAFSLFVLPA